MEKTKKSVEVFIYFIKIAKVSQNAAGKIAIYANFTD